MRVKRPVLTLICSNANYDFSSVIGQKKELDARIQKKLDADKDRIYKGIINAKKYNLLNYYII